MAKKMPSIRNIAEAYIYLTHWKQQVMLAGVAWARRQGRKAKQQ